MKSRTKKSEARRSRLRKRIIGHCYFCPGVLAWLQHYLANRG